MGILIGTDEAGYGPNLGPLVVAATAWQVAEERSEAGGRSSGNGEVAAATGQGRHGFTSAARSDLARTAVCDAADKMPRLCDVDLYRLLRPVVSKKTSERRIAIADSKALYHPGLGLRQLERGLHAVLRAMGETHRLWSTLVEFCQADPDGQHRRHCWPDDYDSVLPIDMRSDELTQLGARFERTCAAAGVRPLVVRARLIFPAEFNELVAHHGTKGAALSHVTVGLLREVVDSLFRVPDATSPSQSPAPSPPPPIHAVCDKHGGRNFYAALLQHHFSEHWVEPVLESRPESRYEWGAPSRELASRFG